MSDTSKLDTCGCCKKTEIEHLKHDNLPGQPAIAYRIGTHATFLRRMLTHLSSQSIPGSPNLRPLASLTTRSSDDPSIALLDAWATAADVLTFYQERIANEGYLRTATERRSILELARAIGYELNPGVAASTYLAFTVDDAPGSPDIATVSKGTKVQSMPAQEKLPQAFETDEDIETRAEWNALKPRLTQPQRLAIENGRLYLVNDINVKNEAKQLYFAGTSTNLKAGDMLLIAFKKDAKSQLETLPIRIIRVVVEVELKRTRVDLVDGAPLIPKFVAPKFSPGIINQQPLTFSEENVKEYILNKKWREHDIFAFLTFNRWNAKDMLKHINTSAVPGTPPIDEGVFTFRQRVGFFGHNAPLFGSLPIGTNMRADPYNNYNWDAATGRDIWEDWQGVIYSNTYSNVDVFLERNLPEILSNTWVVFEGGGVGPNAYRINTVSENSLTGYGLSAKTTGLKLKLPDGTTDPDTNPNTRIHFKVRRTTAYVQSERLELADLPIGEPLEEIDKQGNKTGAASLMLDHMVLGLHAGQPLVLSGEQVDAPGVIRNEVVKIKDIIHCGGYTILCFLERLKYRYVRKTVKLSANVALATHGETVREVLGSGDGSQAHQHFVLKKPPLTYVSASTPSGSESTLEVRVNDILWREVPSLYGLDARSQNYIVRIDNDARAMVMTGDGKSGARLPTGTENIVAIYRNGIGDDGEVGSGSLTLLQTRPLGIREVTNPIAATGAKAPEKLEMARINAPRTVLTFDRIVSLRDFEDFARSFGSIGMVQAVSLWNGKRHLVRITVADANGNTISNILKTKLNNAIKSVCDPVQQFEVADFIPLTFSLEANILVDPRYLFEDVKKKVENTLLEAFAFEKRDFGQAVTAAEIMKIIQDVEGVIAVDLEKLAKDVSNSSPSQPPPILTANKARWENKQILLAELLLLNPTGITLKKMEERT